MDPRLEHLDLFDRWLLSLTPLQFRLFAVTVALAVNIPAAWAESRIPLDPGNFGNYSF